MQGPGFDPALQKKAQTKVTDFSLWLSIAVEHPIARWAVNWLSQPHADGFLHTTLRRPLQVPASPWAEVQNKKKLKNYILKSEELPIKFYSHG